MFNDLIDITKDKGIGFITVMSAEKGKSYLMTFVSLLFYLNPNKHQSLNKLLILFDILNNYNKVLNSLLQNYFASWQAFAAYMPASSGLRGKVSTYEIIIIKKLSFII